MAFDNTGRFIPDGQRPSIEQGVNNNNTQSTQNFLSALNKVGAGSNNTFMNGSSQQGQQAQAGFQGFNPQNQGRQQQQGGYGQQYSQGYANPSGQGYANPSGQSYNQGQQPRYQMQQPPMRPQNYMQPMQQGGIQYVSNGSQTNQNYGMQNGAYQGNSGYNDTAYAGNAGVSIGGTGGLQGQPQYQQPNPWGQSLNTLSNDPSIAAQQMLSPPEAAQSGSYYSTNAPGQPGTVGGGQQYIQPATQPWVPVDSNGNPMGTATSDVNAKTNIKSGNPEVEDFLNQLGVYSYEYKDPSHGEGERISPMAQEIERSQLGKQMVVEGNDGYKRVDYGKMAGLQLASTALINHKLNTLEKVVAKLMKKRA